MFKNNAGHYLGLKSESLKEEFHANARTKSVTKADFTMLHALSVVALIAITTINKQKTFAIVVVLFCCMQQTNEQE